MAGQTAQTGQVKPPDGIGRGSLFFYTGNYVSHLARSVHVCE